MWLIDSEVLGPASGWSESGNEVDGRMMEMEERVLEWVESMPVLDSSVVV